MTKHIRHSALEYPTNRAKLPITSKPVWVKIGDGIGLGYRRNTTAGNWVMRVPTGDGNYWTKNVGLADDHAAADNATVFSFYQAQDEARRRARGSDTAAITTTSDGKQKPITVADALDLYEAELLGRGGDVENVRKVKKDLPSTLGAKLVSQLEAGELNRWRNTVAKRKVMRRGGKEGETKIAPSTVNRNTAAFKAALNHAASLDRKRITNAAEWKTGLAEIADSNVARNAIIADAQIASIVSACYADPRGDDLGLLADVCAQTGTRCSQAARLLVEDLRPGKKPVINLPVSKKGKGKKAISHITLPITPGLAQRLQQAAVGRKSNQPLLLTCEGLTWGKSCHNRRFREAVKRAGLKGISVIAFRHSSIVRQLLDNVPVRVVAVNHDTSVKMIEQNYSKYIGSHTEDLTRGTLVDFVTVRGGSVVNIGGRR